MNLARTYNAIIERGKARSEGSGLHAHRIVPGFQNGEYVQDNVTYLTRKEHRVVHRIRYKMHDHWEDLSAAKFLDMKMSDEQAAQILLEAAKAGGRVTGILNAINKTGVCGRSKEQMSRDGKKANAAVSFEQKSARTKGKIWINNGVETKRIAKNVDIPMGYSRGRLKQGDKRG